MATLTATGHRIITENKRWEDFTSLKQNFRYKHVKQIDISVSQLTTAAFAVLDGSDHTIAAQLAAEACVFLSTIADDNNQDLKSVWVIYQDDTGLIYDAVESLINDTADTSVEYPLGNEDVWDTCASVAGNAITMTALAGTLDQYAGKYTVGVSGNGDQIGVANLIVSNTNATPTVITLTDTPDANTATDIISIQTYPCKEFYRVREMYCEVEVLDAKTIRLGDHDSSNIYAGIGEGHRYMVSPNFFTQPAATCASYLGRIKASFPYDFTATKNGGASLMVYYTPKEAHSDGGAVETEIEIPFANELVWEPCIELEPATDVIIKVKKINDALHDEIFVEVSYLEVY